MKNITAHVDLRYVEIDDAEFILSLRLDKNKNKYLSSVGDDLEIQKEWIAAYKRREKDGSEYYYVIEERNDKRHESLGVVRLYNFKESSFCWGSWILKDGAPAYAAIESALNIYEEAFFSLFFLRSEFDVRKQNMKVVNFHKRFGATIIGEDELNYYFNLEKATYINKKNKYKKFFLFGP